MTSSLIEDYNALPLSTLTTYLPALDINTHTLTLETAATLPPSSFTACFTLVSNIQDMYKRTIGWNAHSKTQEMLLPTIRYLLLQPHNTDTIVGFLSFMLTQEDHRDVVYCYELHLEPQSQGQGLGAALLRVLEGFARAVNVPKVMLTCFVENEAACRFYARNGYVQDGTSPVLGLKGGVMPSYCILSKVL